MESANIVKELDRLKANLSRLKPAIDHVEAANQATLVLSGIADEQLKLKDALQQEFRNGVSLAGTELQEKAEKLLRGFQKEVLQIEQRSTSNTESLAQAFQARFEKFEALQDNLAKYEQRLQASVGKMDATANVYERLNLPSWMDETGKSLGALDNGTQSLNDEFGSLRKFFEEVQKDAGTKSEQIRVELAALKSGLTSISTSIGTELGINRSEIKRELETISRDLIAKTTEQNAELKSALTAMGEKSAQASKTQLATTIIAAIIIAGLVLVLLFKR